MPFRVQVVAELMAPAQAAADVMTRGAAAAEADALSRAIPPRLDEFGRDENAYRRDRAAARAARRRALLDALACRAHDDASAAAALLDAAALDAAAAARGDDTGDDGHEAYYARRVGELHEVAVGVFADVAPEFATLGAALARLATFKRDHLPQYRTAYVSEALPALVSVFVRLQLLQWDPLHAHEAPAAAVASFEEQPWFHELFDFSATGACHARLGCPHGPPPRPPAHDRCSPHARSRR